MGGSGQRTAGEKGIYQKAGKILVFAFRGVLVFVIAR